MHSIIFVSVEDLYGASISTFDSKFENFMSTTTGMPETCWEVIYLLYKIAQLLYE